MPTLVAVPVAEDTSGTLDKVDTVNVGASRPNDQIRQVAVLGDPTTAAGMVAVLNAQPATADYGLVVRAIIAKGALAAPAAVSVTTTATLLMAANTGREVCAFYNNGTQTVYLGASGVTVAAGYPLAAGAEWRDGDSTSAWYGIVPTGTADVRVLEIS